jgi:hypothetical protein
MGFYDNYTDGSGGNFIGKEEREELIASGEGFPITKVSEGTSQWGAKFYVEISLDEETRVMSFTKESVESRDRMLAALKEYLESDENDGSSLFKLVRVGKSILLKNAEEE